MVLPRPETLQRVTVAKPGTLVLIVLTLVGKFDIRELCGNLSNPFLQKKVRRQKHSREADKCRNSISYINHSILSRCWCCNFKKWCFIAMFIACTLLYCCGAIVLLVQVSAIHSDICLVHDTCRVVSITLIYFPVFDNIVISRESIKHQKHRHLYSNSFQFLGDDLLPRLK